MNIHIIIIICRLKIATRGFPTWKDLLYRIHQHDMCFYISSPFFTPRAKESATTPIPYLLDSWQSYWFYRMFSMLMITYFWNKRTVTIYSNNKHNKRKITWRSFLFLMDKGLFDNLLLFSSLPLARYRKKISRSVHVEVKIFVVTGTLTYIHGPVPVVQILLMKKYPSAFFIITENLMEGLDAGTYKNKHVINGKISLSLLIAFTLEVVSPSFLHPNFFLYICTKIL
ncbi:hypothetical protein ACJX0J_024008 [Zea mays]